MLEPGQMTGIICRSAEIKIKWYNKQEAQTRVAHRGGNFRAMGVFWDRWRARGKLPRECPDSVESSEAPLKVVLRDAGM